jgi:hypothetical protein
MMKTKFGLLSILVILTMLLTACEIGVTTKINADGSGEMGGKFVFTQDEVNALSSMGMGSADDFCASLSSDSTGLSSGDMTFTQETHGNDIWCVASQPFATLDELGQGDSGLTINKAEIANDKFVLDADFDLGQDFDASSMAMITSSGYSIVMYYEVTAPGTIDKSKTQGFDKINGNTARMTIIDTSNKDQPVPSGTIHIALESSLKGGSSGGSSGIDLSGGKVAGVSIWIVVVALCCCLLLVVIIIVVVFFVMKRKPKQPGM